MFGKKTESLLHFILILFMKGYFIVGKLSGIIAFHYIAKRLYEYVFGTKAFEETGFTRLYNLMVLNSIVLCE